MKIKESSFAGFLDGYQSRNIAYIENHFHYKIADVKNTLHWLQQELRNNPGQNPPLESALEWVQDIRTDKNYNSLIDQLSKVGEFLRLNIDILNAYKNNPDLRVYTKVKLLIFNFVELAKLSEEPKLINLAIEIGARFHY